MEYNTKRSKLVMSEYGRNVQTMIEQIVEVEDREKRTAMAQAVVELMALLNPSIKQQDEWKHKLWDHLHIISGYRLDVDGPFELPKQEEVESKPERIPYPKSDIEYAHYGKNIDALIEKCLATEDEEKRREFSVLIANFMKMVYRNWNREDVADTIIKNDLRKISGGKIDLPEDVSLYALDAPHGRAPKHGPRGGHGHPGHGGHHGRRRDRRKRGGGRRRRR